MASSRARSHDLMIIRVTSESVKAQPDELTLAGKQKNANVIKDKLCCQERLKKNSFNSLRSNHFYTSSTCHKISHSMSSVFLGTRPKNHIQSPKKLYLKSTAGITKKVDF